MVMMVVMVMLVSGGDGDGDDYLNWPMVLDWIASTSS